MTSSSSPITTIPSSNPPIAQTITSQHSSTSQGSDHLYPPNPTIRPSTPTLGGAASGSRTNPSQTASSSHSSSSSQSPATNSPWWNARRISFFAAVAVVLAAAFQRLLSYRSYYLQHGHAKGTNTIAERVLIDTESNDWYTQCLAIHTAGISFDDKCKTKILSSQIAGIPSTKGERVLGLTAGANLDQSSSLRNAESFVDDVSTGNAQYAQSYPTLSCASATDRPLRILSLDGGGIRGLASLYVLQDLMDRIKVKEKLVQPPPPCEWFDLIVGTSTGGLIALMTRPGRG